MKKGHDQIRDNFTNIMYPYCMQPNSAKQENLDLNIKKFQANALVCRKLGTVEKLMGIKALTDFIKFS